MDLLMGNLMKTFEYVRGMQKSFQPTHKENSHLFCFLFCFVLFFEKFKET